MRYAIETFRVNGRALCVLRRAFESEENCSIPHKAENAPHLTQTDEVEVLPEDQVSVSRLTEYRLANRNLKQKEV